MPDSDTLFQCHPFSSKAYLSATLCAHGSDVTVRAVLNIAALGFYCRFSPSPWRLVNLGETLRWAFLIWLTSVSPRSKTD